MSVLYIVAKLFVSLIGLLALRLMLVMYEPEEERWQEATIEAGRFAGGRAIKAGRECLDYLAKVANVTSRILNRVFGDRLFSLQFVAVSTAYSCAAWAWSFPILVYLTKMHGRTEAAAQFLFFTEQMFVSIGVVCFVLGFLPSFFHRRSRWFCNLFSLFALFPILAIVWATIRIAENRWSLLTLLIALSLSCLVDLRWTIWVRSTLRELATNPRTKDAVLAALVQPLIMALV